MTVAQMDILPVRSSSVDDAKYLFRTVIIFGISLSYLIVRWLYASGLAHSIWKFESPYFRVSNRYAYLSLNYSVKYDKSLISTLMVTKTILTLS